MHIHVPHMHRRVYVREAGICTCAARLLPARAEVDYLQLTSTWCQSQHLLVGDHDMVATTRALTGPCAVARGPRLLQGPKVRRAGQVVRESYGEVFSRNLAKDQGYGCAGEGPGIRASSWHPKNGKSPAGGMRDVGRSWGFKRE